MKKIAITLLCLAVMLSASGCPKYINDSGTGNYNEMAADDKVMPETDEIDQPYDEFLREYSQWEYDPESLK